jgi:hypothetical protein
MYRSAPCTRIHLSMSLAGRISNDMRRIILRTEHNTAKKKRIRDCVHQKQCRELKPERRNLLRSMSPGGLADGEALASVGAGLDCDGRRLTAGMGEPILITGVV